MVTHSQDVIQHFGNRVRVRVCGICTQGDRLLLVNHTGLGGSTFWAPPGGGVEVNERVTDALIREFREETGLEVTVSEFLFVCEFIKSPLHAIELFFRVQVKAGSLQQGHDPELQPGKQLIQDIAFKDWPEINRLTLNEKHGILHLCSTAEDLSKLAGFYRI